MDSIAIYLVIRGCRGPHLCEAAGFEATSRCWLADLRATAPSRFITRTVNQMVNHTKPLIAVIGASGHQGGGVVRALQASGKFRVRALTRDPVKHKGLADEVAAADLNRPETLQAAFEGAHGVFAVTNFWEPGGGRRDRSRHCGDRCRQTRWRRALRLVDAFERPEDQRRQIRRPALHRQGDGGRSGGGLRGLATTASSSLLPSTRTSWAREAPRSNGMGPWAGHCRSGRRPRSTWAISSELGRVVAGAFLNPELAGRGQYLPHVGQVLSYGDIVATLNKQGHALTFTSVPRDVFANFFPGAAELAQMFGYIDEFGYLGRSMGDADCAGERRFLRQRQLTSRLGRVPTCPRKSSLNGPEQAPGRDGLPCPSQATP